MSRPAKRTASSELNSDNWDDEEEPEEMGSFKPVGQEELSKRVIKVARRRLPKNSSGQLPMMSFSGFGNQPFKPADVKSSFSFLSNLNGASNNKNESSSEINNKQASIGNGKNETDVSSDKPGKSTEESNYLSGIKSLNDCLLDWVNQCIKKNPSCILTPIFQDYEKHLETLKKPVLNNDQSSKPLLTPNVPTLLFHSEKSVKNDSPQTAPTLGSNKSEPFKFSLTSGSNSSEPNTGNSGAASNAPSSNWLASNTISKPNLFSNMSTNLTQPSPSPMFSFSRAPETADAAKDGGDGESKEEDEVPVNDFKPVTEDDALFSQRVKLFVSKDKQYKDCGVGMFYIKEVKDGSDKKIHQGIVRADTSLGNIIFNIRISESIPTKRLGKNNVMLVCIPTPDAKPPPVPVLLRVKTSEEADKLLEEIDKYK